MQQASSPEGVAFASSWGPAAGGTLYFFLCDFGTSSVNSELRIFSLLQPMLEFRPAARIPLLAVWWHRV